MLQIRDQGRAWDSAFPGCSQGRCIIAPGPEPRSEEQEFRGWGICIVLEPVRAQQHSCLSSPSESVKFCKLLSIVLSTWLTASGFIHLVSISSNPLMLLVRMNVFSVKTGANLPSSCLHHCSQREVYLFTSFGWVFLHSIFLTSMYLLHSQYPCVFSQLSKPALREGFNKLIHLRYKQYVKCILYHAFPAIWKRIKDQRNKEIKK